MTLNTVNDDLSKLLQLENGCEYTNLDDNAVENLAVQGRDATVFNVLHLNIRGFCKNSDNLVLVLKELEEKGIIVHVLALCETYLSTGSEALASLENYTPFHKSRLE